MVSVQLQPIYGYGGRTVATFANPEGMKDCFYVPDPFMDLKNVRPPPLPLISAECATVPFLLSGFACRHLQTACRPFNSGVGAAGAG